MNAGNGAPGLAHMVCMTHFPLLLPSDQASKG